MIKGAISFSSVRHIANRTGGQVKKNTLFRVKRFPYGIEEDIMTHRYCLNGLNITTLDKNCEFEMAEVLFLCYEIIFI